MSIRDTAWFQVDTGLKQLQQNTTQSLLRTAGGIVIYYRFCKLLYPILSSLNNLINKHEWLSRGPLGIKSRRK